VNRANRGFFIAQTIRQFGQEITTPEGVQC
jgi:hypothetical protein